MMSNARKGRGSLGIFGVSDKGILRTSMVSWKGEVYASSTPIKGAWFGKLVVHKGHQPLADVLVE
jgi:hypothetical protein